MGIKETVRKFLADTEPRDAEAHFGTEDTVKQAHDVRQPNHNPDQYIYPDGTKPWLADIPVQTIQVGRHRATEDDEVSA